ncbi:uncharacterized protein [Tursiops truncatus]|uniref:uncharacterized protein isoform X2 n=1 Tax=Tursiops truncatus TaxID=9739 RepID=UPI003CCF07B9
MGPGGPQPRHRSREISTGGSAAGAWQQAEAAWSLAVQEEGVQPKRMSGRQTVPRRHGSKSKYRSRCLAAARGCQPRELAWEEVPVGVVIMRLTPPRPLQAATETHTRGPTPRIQVLASRTVRSSCTGPFQAVVTWSMSEGRPGPLLLMGKSQPWKTTLLKVLLSRGGATLRKKDGGGNLPSRCGDQKADPLQMKTADHKNIDPRLVETRRLIKLETSP